MKRTMPVCDYMDFAKAVLKIPEAHEMVTKYTVLDNDKKKLVNSETISDSCN